MRHRLHPFATRARLLTGLLAGLACARLGLDYGGGLPATLVALAIGVALGAAWPAPRWPLFGLFAVLASPVPLPRLTVWAIALVAAGRLVARRGSPRWAALAGAAALGLFALAAAPGALPGDAGEFQVVVARWGVAHPPGYPLYTLLAGALGRLVPVGLWAWRVNVFSAIVGALAVAAVGVAVAGETRRAWAGWIAGLALAASATFWMVATQASIRPLSVLLVAAMLEAMLAYRRAARANRATRPALIRFGLAAGFGVTHHGSLVFLGAVLAGAIAAADWRAWRRWPVAVLAALPGALPWLYFLVRADGFLAPAGLDTWGGFWDHVLARGFAGDALGSLGPDTWPEHWQVAREMVALQWPLALIALALAGLAAALIRDRWLGLTLAAGLLVHTAVSITYPASPMSEYMLPVYVLLAVAAGWLVGTVPRPWSTLLSAAALAGIALGLAANWRTTERLYDHEAERRAVLLETLIGAPEGALALAPWHSATALWYAQQVDGIRPDVEVRYVAPQGAETPMETWAGAIEAGMAAGRDVIALQQFPETYRSLPYTLAGTRVLDAPPATPAPPDAIRFGPHALWPDWRWLSGDSQSLRAGEMARLQLTWTLGEPVPYGALTVFVHVGQPDAPPVAQVDLPVQAPSLDGDAGTLSLAVDLLIPPAVPPGEWTLFAGAYTPGGPLTAPGGQPRVALGTVRVNPGPYPMPTQHWLAHDMDAARLIGWDVDGTLPGERVLYLHWKLGEPDRAYTVTLEDTAGGRWAPVTAQVGDVTGYWTSVHSLPPAIASEPVRVHLDGESVLLPGTDGDAHYIPFGNVAALVDWRIAIEGGEATVGLTWLPFGAAATNVKIAIGLQGEGWQQPADFEPVRGQLPAYRWLFGRTVRTEQVIALEGDSPPDAITVQLYDGYTAQVAPVDDRYQTANSPGAVIGP